VRQGIVPFHAWVPELFAGAPLGAALLHGVAQLGAYAGVRVVAPDAPEDLALALCGAALATAVYGAGTALVQDDPRRSFGCVFLSQSALVVAGLGSGSPVGVAGALALWISSGLALAGFGATLWVLEARRGPLSLRRFHGGYERMPIVATCFLVFGLACVGFPGTLGFVGEELLLHGLVEGHSRIGALVAIAAALNGIAVVRMYFHLFCGARDRAAVAQRIRPREALGFTALAVLLVAGGLAPAAFIASRSRAALELASRREAAGPAVDSAPAGVVQSPSRDRGPR
jgi:NADH-quinone oxidoreductase subunit M